MEGDPAALSRPRSVFRAPMFRKAFALSVAAEFDTGLAALLVLGVWKFVLLALELVYPIDGATLEVPPLVLSFANDEVDVPKVADDVVEVGMRVLLLGRAKVF